jgi:hypothetical protein
MGRSAGALGNAFVGNNQQLHQEHGRDLGFPEPLLALTAGAGRPSRSREAVGERVSLA